MVFVISAPSGSGKTTLLGGLLRAERNLVFSISYTTRKPRGNEVDGTNYHFVSREDFEARVAREEFLEWADVFGNYYGTHRSELERARLLGCNLLLDIDVKGARQLKERVPEAISIFILPPSREELEKRLRARGEDSEEVIQRRLREAAAEIKNYGLYDYILVNDDVEQSTANLIAIIQAERVRRVRMEGRIGPVLSTFDLTLTAGTQ
ncbi:MAG: guanylate kinase [Bryobacteraceae bacterium]|nr:guanylate kinase [Bryobacteraceae bacterium]